MLCMGPVIATGWIIFSFLICSSCRKVSVAAFCFLISEENASSYLTALILNSELLWSERRTVHVRTFCRVSSSPHPSGQVLSGYICPKSVLIPPTVLVRSLNSRFLLSLLNIGLERYGCNSSLEYFSPSIFECFCCSFFRYSSAADLTLVLID